MPAWHQRQHQYKYLFVCNRSSRRKPRHTKHRESRVKIKLACVDCTQELVAGDGGFSREMKGDLEASIQNCFDSYGYCVH